MIQYCLFIFHCITKIRNFYTIYLIIELNLLILKRDKIEKFINLINLHFLFFILYINSTKKIV